MAKRTKRSIKKSLDKLCSKITRSVGRCAKCFSIHKQLHAHHLIGRRNMAVRFDLDNLICLCSRCHSFAPDSFHADPYNEKNLEAIHREIGVEEFAAMKRRSKQIRKWTIDELIELEEELKR